jgi:hemerythrin-like domain-containing protein
MIGKTSIGRLRTPGPGFDEPLEMLQACHGRIEERLSTLERLAEHVAARGADAKAQSAVRDVLRYFDTAGALHHQDEDEDLFPLLRKLAAAQGRSEIAAAIDELEREHATMHGLWSALRKSLERVLLGEARLDVENVARFCWLYRRHMDRETAAVLPFARQALSAQQRASLGERMAARRKT